jgi:putative transposase
VEAGLAVPELCRELGISTATFYKWRSKFGGMDTSMMARMKELEIENARLKKMYAEERPNRTLMSNALTELCAMSGYRRYWTDLDAVRDHATRWLWSYNHERPNMALGGITPKQRLAMAA